MATPATSLSGQRCQDTVDRIMGLMVREDLVRFKPFVEARIVLLELDGLGPSEQIRVAPLLTCQSPERRPVERRPSNRGRDLAVHTIPNRRDIEHQPVYFKDEVHGSGASCQFSVVSSGLITDS